MSVEDVELVLTEAGFSVQAGAVAACDGLTPKADVLAWLTNEEKGPYEEVQDREGIVSCEIFRGPVYPPELEKDLDAPANSPIFSGRKANFRVKNVYCNMYAGDDRQDEQVARLDDAMTRLERSST